MTLLDDLRDDPYALNRAVDFGTPFRATLAGVKPDPLDVWLRFEHPDDEEAAYEANTFRTADGGYRIEWYHNAVGLVAKEDFDTLDEAYAWYERNGYQDFTP